MISKMAVTVEQELRSIFTDQPFFTVLDPVPRLLPLSGVDRIQSLRWDLKLCVDQVSTAQSQSGRGQDADQETGPGTPAGAWL